MMTTVDFTLGGYSMRLRNILSSGYSISGDFSELKSSKTVYLRHDVDLSLEAALEIARVESELGVRSTYFVLMSSDFYNPLSTVSRKMLTEILNLNHSIGLHFDQSVFRENSPEALQESVSIEAALLEQIIEIPVGYFSQHRPGTHGFFPTQNLEIFDVYRQLESPDISYVSDATGTFRFGDYSELFESEKSFQLLTHPIWWASTKGEHPRLSLDNFLSGLGEKQARLLGRTVAKFDLPLGSEGGWLPNIDRKQIGIK